MYPLAVGANGRAVFCQRAAQSQEEPTGSSLIFVLAARFVMLLRLCTVILVNAAT